MQSSQKRFSCPHCSKVYTKQEHLSRHQRTHYDLKPFSCDICGRRFGRQDVLKRHVKLHAPSSDCDAPSIPEPDNEQSFGSPDTPTSVLARKAPDEEAVAGEETTRSQIPTNTDVPPVDPENFMEWLMPDLLNSSSVPFPLTDFSILSSMQIVSGHSPGQSADQRGDSAYEASKTAVRQISTLIDDLCTSLNSEAETTGVTSAFFNACVHEYFERISPCFPVLHAPTFQAHDCIPPLLLNIFALGSLFVTLPGSNNQGDILWRLAHTAVATSWHSFMAHKGPYDSCHGVQLVLTALLGQTYAILSNNPSIRNTAFVFHGLGFFWARTSGMYNSWSFPLEDIPTEDVLGEEKVCRWKSWVARETQRRAILGHYILDGLIARSSGSPPSARHLINSVGTACRDTAFSAQTVEDWIIEMQNSLTVEQPMSAVYKSLMSPEYASTPIPLSAFSTCVVLEGLQSLVSELSEASTPAIGVVSRREIILALINLYEGNIISVGLYSTSDSVALLLRWHAVCLEVSSPSTALFQSICSTHRQLRYPGRNSNSMNCDPRKMMDLNAWSKSGAAMRSLLHAIAIKQLFRDIPLAQALAPHIPNAIFASAVVFSVMCLSHIFTIKLPTHFRWQDAWSTILNQEEQPLSHTHNDERQQPTLNDVLQHLDASGTQPSKTVTLLNEINFLRLTMKTVASRWPFSAELESVIGQLGKLAHEESIFNAQ